MDGSRLVEETAAISWRRDAGQQAWFHNVLRIDRFTVDHGLGTIDLEFSLSRSIGSRVLWDERAGGISRTRDISRCGRWEGTAGG